MQAPVDLYAEFATASWYQSSYHICMRMLTA
jgi:hypothetical protein